MDKLLAAVRSQICDKDGEPLPGKRVEWTIKDTVVCRYFWEKAHHTGAHTVDYLKQLISEGHNTLPDKMPRVPAAGSQAKDKADTFLLYMYNGAQSYADDNGPQPLPSDETLDQCRPCGSTLAADSEFYELLDSTTHPLWTKGIAIPGASGDFRAIAKKWLNPGTFESEIWQAYQNHGDPDKVSRSTLFKVYKEGKWDQIMPFRGEGQGKRCKICSQLDELRKQETTSEGKENPAVSVL